MNVCICCIITFILCFFYESAEAGQWEHYPDFSVDEFKLYKSLWSVIHCSWVGNLKRRCMTYSSRVFLLSLFPHLLCNSRNIRINVDRSHLSFISSNCLQKIFEIILVVVDFMTATTYLISCLNPAVHCWFVTTPLLLVAKQLQTVREGMDH